MSTSTYFNSQGNEITLTHSFIFITNGADDVRKMYEELNELPQSKLVEFPNHPFNKKNIFIKLMLSNRWSFLHLQNILYFIYIIFRLRALKKNSEKLPLCIIVYGRTYEFYKRFGLMFLLKRFFKNAVLTCWLSDIISSYKFDVKKLKNDFSKIFTFDICDAKKYDFLFVQEPMTYLDLPDEEIKYDVTFVGRAKSRLKKIIEVYEFLKKNGLVCDFHIVDIPQDEMVYSDEIEYNKPIPFIEVIRHVKQSRCIFEIMQTNDGTGSPTARYQEALLYNKRLLTDCIELKNKRDDYPDTIIYFNDIKDIDFSKIKAPLLSSQNNYKEYLSVKNMLHTIDSYL